MSHPLKLYIMYLSEKHKTHIIFILMFHIIRTHLALENSGLRDVAVLTLSLRSCQKHSEKWAELEKWNTARYEFHVFSFFTFYAICLILARKLQKIKILLFIWYFKIVRNSARETIRERAHIMEMHDYFLIERQDIVSQTVTLTRVFPVPSHSYKAQNANGEKEN